MAIAKFTNEYIIALAKRMTPGNAEAIIARWKMSSEEASLLRFLDGTRDKHGSRQTTQDWIVAIVTGEVSQTNAVNLFALLDNISMCQALADFVLPEIPISGKDVLDMGIKPGPVVRIALRKIREYWAKSNFAPDRKDLLSRLEKIVKEL
jgi:hypothetical protein